MRKFILGVACLVVSTYGAAAQDEVLVTLKVMTPETALKLAQAALKDCRGRGYQVAVAVVDRFGSLQVLLRDRFAGPHTPETARRKAWTAVSFRTDTVNMAEFTAEGKEAWGARFVDQALMLGGGVTVAAAGSLVGAVGISGGPSGTADDECARVGIAAIQEELDF